MLIGFVWKLLRSLRQPVDVNKVGLLDFVWLHLAKAENELVWKAQVVQQPDHIIPVYLLLAQSLEHFLRLLLNLACGALVAQRFCETRGLVLDARLHLGVLLCVWLVDRDLFNDYFLGKSVN